MSGDRGDGVLFVLPDFNGGGAEQAVLRVVKAWPTDLARPVLAVKSTTGPLADEFRETGIEIVDLGGGTRHSAMSSVRSALALRRLVARTKPAAVVAVLSAPFVVGACRSLRRRPRIVVSVQNPVLVEMRPGLRRSVVSASLRAADAVLPISPGIANEVEQQGVPPERITVVPNPVEVAAFSPGAAEREKTVVMLVRLEPQKRVDIALEAFAAAGLDGWQLHIYGTGSERSMLEERVDSLGLRDVVQFCGFTSDAASVLRTAGFMLLTSEYEGFGNVLVEALATGTRVVSTDAPWGPRFVLDDGRYGELCAVNDVASIADAMRRAAKSDDDAVDAQERMARAAAFDSPVVAQAMADAVLGR